MKALTVINSKSGEVWKYIQLLVPYLEHFGVPCEYLDIGRGALAVDRQRHPLIILSHPDILSGLDGTTEAVIIKRIEETVKQGAGLVSFDPLFPMPELSAGDMKTTKTNRL